MFDEGEGFWGEGVCWVGGFVFGCFEGEFAGFEVS